MEILDLTDIFEWSETDVDNNFKLLDSPLDDYNNELNEVEGNGGNGIEINWDKYVVSYDCPKCVGKMLAYNSRGERMWADHMTPIFKSHNTTKCSQSTEQPSQHISTCAFYYFQPPETNFDIEYLDAVVKKEKKSSQGSSQHYIGW